MGEGKNFFFLSSKEREMAGKMQEWQTTMELRGMEGDELQPGDMGRRNLVQNALSYPCPMQVLGGGLKILQMGYLRRQGPIAGVI